MTCPVCFSADLDREAHCGFCGVTIDVQRELRLRSGLPAPRTRVIEDDREDYALREGGG